MVFIRSISVGPALEQPIHIWSLLQNNFAKAVMSTPRSRGRIQVTEYDAETAEMARTQFIRPAATGILKQADMRAREVLKLVQ